MSTETVGRASATQSTMNPPASSTGSINGICDDSPMADKKAFFEKLSQKETPPTAPNPRGRSPRNNQPGRGGTPKTTPHASATQAKPWKKSPSSFPVPPSQGGRPSPRRTSVLSTSNKTPRNNNISSNKRGPASSQAGVSQPSPVFSELQHMWGQAAARGRTPIRGQKEGTPGSTKSSGVATAKQPSKFAFPNVPRQPSGAAPRRDLSQDKRTTPSSRGDPPAQQRKTVILPDPPTDYADEEKKEDPEELLDLTHPTRPSPNSVEQEEMPRVSDLRQMWTPSTKSGATAAPPQPIDIEVTRLPSVIIPEVSPSQMKPRNSRKKSPTAQGMLTHESALLPDSMNGIPFRTQQTQEGSDDEEEDEEEAVNALRNESFTKEMNAMKTSAATITRHAQRSYDKYQAMLDLTQEYRSSSTTTTNTNTDDDNTTPSTSPQEETSPISQYIQKFEAFSKGEKAVSQKSIAENTEQEKEKNAPKRFSFYTPGNTTINLLQNISEPEEKTLAFEPAPSPVVRTGTTTVPEEKQGSQPSLITGLRPEEEEELAADDEDEIARVTQKYKAAAAVKKAAAKISQSSSSLSQSDERDRYAVDSSLHYLPTEEENGYDSSALDNSISMSEAAGMDTSLALDDETYDRAMVLVKLSGSSKGGAPPPPVQASHRATRTASTSPGSPMVEPQSRCGGVCAIM